jgi:hypothetical protein
MTKTVVLTSPVGRIVYTPPELDGHAVPYKGKRYWVIAVDDAHPFDWVSSDIASHAIYDKSMGYVIATVKPMDHCRMWVQMATQCDSGFLVEDLRDAVQTAGQVAAQMLAKGWG